MAIFDEVMAADAVIYASPLYAWSFPAQMKAFIDRHYCCITNPGRPEQSSVLEGKRVALLITCSEPMENNADVIQTIFDRIFLRLHCIISGKYIVESSSAPDFEQRARKTARQIAGDVTAR
jgi:multimeric flavodoxin WrbA